MRPLVFLKQSFGTRSCVPELIAGHFFLAFAMADRQRPDPGGPQWLQDQARRLDQSAAQAHDGSVGESRGAVTAREWTDQPSAHRELAEMRKASAKPASFNPERHVRFIRGRPAVASQEFELR